MLSATFITVHGEPAKPFNFKTRIFIKKVNLIWAVNTNNGNGLSSNGKLIPYVVRLMVVIQNRFA